MSVSPPSLVQARVLQSPFLRQTAQLSAEWVQQEHVQPLGGACPGRAYGPAAGSAPQSAAVGALLRRRDSPHRRRRASLSNLHAKWHIFELRIAHSTLKLHAQATDAIARVWGAWAMQSPASRGAPGSKITKFIAFPACLAIMCRRGVAPVA